MHRFKSFSVVVHVAGWLLFMAFPLLFLNNHGQNLNQFALLKSPYYWMFGATYIALFYINIYLLIPRFLLKKNYIDFAIGILVLFACVYFLKPFDKLLKGSEKFSTVQVGDRPMNMPQGEGGMPPQGPPPNGMPQWGPPPDGSRPQGPPPGGNFGDRNQHRMSPRNGRRIDSNSIFIFIMIMALSTATRIIRQWQITEQRATQAEADKAAAELSFLKAQINPHFLFNTLNNIYTLAVTESEYTADSIMKLSNIMRYVTDEATQDFVPLQDEIDCISDYIELQKLRIGETTQVNFVVAGNTNGKNIVPLVMMTFIENVFKYGVSKNESSAIDIAVDITATHIAFVCKNQIFNASKASQRTGIGIKNTRKRLEHLYPGKHLLNITETDNTYTVQLTLQA